MQGGLSGANPPEERRIWHKKQRLNPPYPDHNNEKLQKEIIMYFLRYHREKDI